MTLLERYSQACEYPGRLDEAAVETNLRAYCEALGVARKIRRITRPWSRVDGLAEFVCEIAHGICNWSALDKYLTVKKILAAKADSAIRAIQASQAAWKGIIHATREALWARDAKIVADALVAAAARDTRHAMLGQIVGGDLEDQVFRGVRNALFARVAPEAKAALEDWRTGEAGDTEACTTAQKVSCDSVCYEAQMALSVRHAQQTWAARAVLASEDLSPVLLREFGNWCITRSGLLYWSDLSWLTPMHLGAVKLKNKSIQRWTKPFFQAFCAGAWYLVWSPTYLYWVAKPVIRTEIVGSGQRLHCETGPACANDVENLYFLNGVLVPAYAVTNPELINLEEIKTEVNEETRRILIERFGWERYLREAKAKQRHRRFNERDGQWETLYRLDDGTQRIVLVDPSTGRRYALGVPRDLAKCEDAQNWMSHGLDSRSVHRS